MLIISKFHDYYDSIQGMGIDKTIVYKRNAKEIVIKSDELKLDGWIDDPCIASGSCTVSGVRFDVSGMVVGFCGTIRPMLEISVGTPIYLDGSESKVHYVYSVEDFDKVMSGLPAKFVSALNRRASRAISSPYSWAYGSYWIDRKAAIDFFKRCPQIEQDDKLFIDNNSPVFVIKRSAFTERTIIVNHPLKDVGFVRVVDPYQAFQRIAQYISGVLGVGEPCTVEISDEDMRDKKGFYSMSFKKDPGVKKPRRRGRK